MFAKRNQIYIGSVSNPDYYFENNQISSCPVTQSVALVGQELAVDTFTPVVSMGTGSYLSVLHFRSSDGHEIETGDSSIYAIDTGEDPGASSLIDIQDGTPIWYYHDSELVGKFYIESVTRTAKNQYRIDSVSAIGRLDHMFHGGGLFLAQTFEDVLQHILASGLHGTGDPVIEYTIDPDVASLPVTGWLPYASKRNNLYQLIFANGVNIVKNYNGNPHFTFVYNSLISAKIADSSIFYGGDVEYTKPYSSVAISEHTYTEILDVEPETLYDNSTGAIIRNEEIWFDQAPVIVSSLTTEGDLTIESATENSAIITGSGVLKGIPYTHSTRVVSRTNPNAISEKVASVEDCTMVSLINSENLLERLYSFYCPEDYIKKITNDFIFTDHRCGKAYTFTNPYGEEETAYLTHVDINASSFDRAQAEWYANYLPAGQAGLYRNVEEIKVDPDNPVYSGEWTVPDGVTEFKVVIIGGGTGGGSGWPGENGKDTDAHVNIETTRDTSGMWYGAEGGDGGEGGTGGTAGHVKVVTVENAVPGTTYEWALGKGGRGGFSTGYIPDTVSELRSAIDNENPDNTYTDEDLANLISIYENTGWEGEPNRGVEGTDSSFGEWSTADEDATTPAGGIYDPVNNNYYAVPGKKGIKGGKGGARKVGSGNSVSWVTDGEDVRDGVNIYRGGRTGYTSNHAYRLDEVQLSVYGGNGAGAAVGLSRDEFFAMDGAHAEGIGWWPGVGSNAGSYWWIEVEQEGGENVNG